VPAQFAARNLYVHNAQVTLMRTTADENAAIGRWIVERVNRMQGPVRFLLPLHGVSAIDAPGKPFHDPAADAALFAAIRTGWKAAPNRRLVEVDAHINDPAFAEAAVHAFRDITRGQ
jgi:uncharacterized protein (UPF0261 family)